MRRARKSCIRRHARDFKGPGYPAHIHHIGLDDIDDAPGDHPRPQRQVPVLFAARDIDVRSDQVPFSTENGGCCVAGIDDDRSVAVDADRTDGGGVEARGERS